MSPLSNDPLGIQNVSGFYGPGSWIAWYLTLATSRSQSSGTITLTISTISAICSTSTGPQSMLYDCLYKIPRTLPTEPQYSLQKTQFWVPHFWQHGGELHMQYRSGRRLSIGTVSHLSPTSQRSDAAARCLRSACSFPRLQALSSTNAYSIQDLSKLS
jgi:hypothetical protein